MVGKSTITISVNFKDLPTIGLKNGILLPKLFWPTVRKKCSSDSNRERSEQFLLTECFFNLFLEVFISNKLEQLEFKLEKIIGI